MLLPGLFQRLWKLRNMYNIKIWLRICYNRFRDVRSPVWARHFTNILFFYFTYPRIDLILAKLFLIYLFFFWWLLMTICELIGSGEVSAVYAMSWSEQKSSLAAGSGAAPALQLRSWVCLMVAETYVVVVERASWHYILLWDNISKAQHRQMLNFLLFGRRLQKRLTHKRY